MENKESVLWEEYISRDTDIYLSQLQLSVLIPTLQEYYKTRRKKLKMIMGLFQKNINKITLLFF